MDLVVSTYALTEGFPGRETYGLALQMRRAAVSIPSNIAEEHAREHGKEYLHCISMSQGSLSELQTQLEIAERLGYLCGDQPTGVLAASVSLAKQLYALRNSVRKSLSADAEDSSVIFSPTLVPQTNTRHPAPTT